ncbi:FRG domain-containing protein [Klebsiella pneumoniae]|uniref:FRG domain-containing protein n=1 Tax=Klebsiella pneumoniae TaxID=573 RepID=UPI002963EAD3|nr:FRG domain-containing protein [Klebsiella pneumoniae]MDW1309263.1 FRG domain-containing protein [Klebsiella pneumoniae]HBR1650053.1 FRG domain-containing protein [Klebsiella pneumoniae]
MMNKEEVLKKKIEINLETAQDFLSYFSPYLNKEFDFRNFIFRGHGNANHKLIPSVLRRDSSIIKRIQAMSARISITETDLLFESKQIQAETAILRQFYKISNRNGLFTPPTERWFKDDIHLVTNQFVVADRHEDEEWLPKELLELAALAQHYGIPTRLMDWTHDALTACFFACTSEVESKEDLCVWAMNANWITLLKKSGKVNRINFFTPNYKNNDNVTAQKGLFTYCSSILKRNIFPREVFLLPREQRDIILGQKDKVDIRPLDEVVFDELTSSSNTNLGDEPFFIKVTLPNSQRMELYRMLILMGYDYPRIYPGYHGIANHLDFLKNIEDEISRQQFLL